MSEAMTLEKIITFLLEAPMFGDLDPSELSQIVHIMQVQRLRAGQVIFEEGDPGDAWYVLYEGHVEVYKDTVDGEQVIATLEPRACFGEMAILDGSPRSAAVRARGRATAFRFPRQAFNELLQQDNLVAYKLVYQMALVLVRRQRGTNVRLVGLLKEQHLASAHGGVGPGAGSSPS